MALRDKEQIIIINDQIREQVSQFDYPANCLLCKSYKILAKFSKLETICEIIIRTFRNKAYRGTSFTVCGGHCVLFCGCGFYKSKKQDGNTQTLENVFLKEELKRQG